MNVYTGSDYVGEDQESGVLADGRTAGAVRETVKRIGVTEHFIRAGLPAHF
jgi:hypothetical protein